MSHPVGHLESAGSLSHVDLPNVVWAHTSKQYVLLRNPFIDVTVSLAEQLKNWEAVKVMVISLSKS
jgi:hypothetical protein